MIVGLTKCLINFILRSRDDLFNLVQYWANIFSSNRIGLNKFYAILIDTYLKIIEWVLIAGEGFQGLKV